MFSPFSPPEIILVFLFEFLFGLGYNALVEYIHRNRLWHVSISVAIGSAATMIIPLAAWWTEALPFHQSVLLTFGCFVSSGIPMIVGSMRRTVSESHKRRPWPTAALRARDETIMELSAMAHEIAEKAKSGELTVRDLPDYVNRLHGVVGMLRSV